MPKGAFGTPPKIFLPPIPTYVRIRTSPTCHVTARYWTICHDTDSMYYRSVMSDLSDLWHSARESYLVGHVRYTVFVVLHDQRRGRCPISTEYRDIRYSNTLTYPTSPLYTTAYYAHQYHDIEYTHLEKNRTFILKILIGQTYHDLLRMSQLSDRSEDALKRFSVRCLSWHRTTPQTDTRHTKGTDQC